VPKSTNESGHSTTSQPIRGYFTSSKYVTNLEDHQYLKYIRVSLQKIQQKTSSNFDDETLLTEIITAVTTNVDNLKLYSSSFAIAITL